jgi:miniconductance mechanosensitive channel
VKILGSKSILKEIYKQKAWRSLAHFFSLLFCFFIYEDIFGRHPRTNIYTERMIIFGQVMVFAVLVYRLIKAVETYYEQNQDRYRITAIKAISESLRIFGIVIFSLIGIFVIFGIGLQTVIGVLGAVTAVVLLVFRDTILGFVTGIHVSTSKNLKIGDWIGIPKYNIEGNIQDINLLTTKIQNFDKTISTIPTYDLMSTEIRNHQIMYEGSSRRIKRSIYFNIKSFKFVDEEFYNKVKDINLISEYLDRKLKEIAESKKGIPHSERLINGQQLTNIGLFRNYVLNFLKNNPKIDQDEIILVRQLEITPQGLPLEIYCFANKAELVDYERIQADIFDHILTAAKEFDLEVMQVNKV